MSIQNGADVWDHLVPSSLIPQLFVVLDTLRPTGVPGSAGP